jgi:hypothetical protein
LELGYRAVIGQPFQAVREFGKRAIDKVILLVFIVLKEYIRQER